MLLKDGGTWLIEGSLRKFWYWDYSSANGRWCRCRIWRLCCQWFGLISSLKINYLECKILGAWIYMIQVEEFTSIFGCHAGSLPSYLWLPLCIINSSKSLWDLVLESWDEIAHLKGQLSIIWRSYLFWSLPLYFLSMFKCPKSVAKRIKCIQRTFPWRIRKIPYSWLENGL